MFYLAPHQAVMIAINLIALVLGAPGNILVLRVYFSKPRKTSTHILIMGLALSDLLSLFVTFPLEIVAWTKEYNITNQPFCRVLSFFYHYFAQCSVLITVAIAIDRYYAVCRPHQWKMTTRRIQIILTTCFMLSSVTSFAAIFSYNTTELDYEAASVYYESNNVNETVTISLCNRDTTSGFNQAVFIIHTVWFCMLFLVLLVAYIKIYLTIRKRVTAGPVSDGDPSRMRVVRPAIRFISHLTVVTNRTGSANRNQTEQSQDRGSNQGSREQNTHSTDDSSSHAAGITLSETAKSHWLQSEKTKTPTGKSDNAVARAFLMAGGLHRPVLPSIGQANEELNGVNQSSPTGNTSVPTTPIGQVTEGFNGINQTSPSEKTSMPTAPNLLPSSRKSTAWNKISLMNKKPVEAALVQGETSSGILAQDGSTQEHDPRGADSVDVSQQLTILGPLAKALQKRTGAATAMNLKIQKKTTNMLLVAALTAVITWLPTVVIETAMPNVHEMIITQPEFAKIMICFMGWLFLFNFVTNPIVYSLMNDRFRDECSKSFRKCKLCSQKTKTEQKE
ncbi:uncharacterized protein [Asterias amurensis]|uniref:uncharacterized protein n=1 Tax=Asterias amurensis TaxID=7602 RepID=UPI003AB237DE